MKFEVLSCKGGWYWRIIAGNGKILAHSESYKRRRDATHAAELVIEHAQSAPLYERKKK